MYDSYIHIPTNKYTNIYSQLSVSRTTDKLDFSISLTHLVDLVGFVSSSMLNLSDKSDTYYCHFYDCYTG